MATMPSIDNLDDQEEALPLARETAVRGSSGAACRGLRRAAPVALLVSALAAAALLLAAKGARWRPGGAVARGEATDVIVAAEAANDGEYEWEVLWKTGVHVRSGPSVYSSALGVKVDKERFRGRQDGDWVALAHQRGFMLIRSGRHVLLRRIVGAGAAAQPAGAAVQAPAAAATPVPARPAPAAAEAEEGEQKTGHFEWEVVSASPVYVRLETSTSSLILGLKPPGEVVVGVREGAWLRLWHNVGYVPISLDGVAQLKERDVAYSRVAGESCAAAARSAIADAAVCEAAATTLGLPNARVRLTESSPLGESGCYVNAAGSLVFSKQATDPDSRGAGDVAKEQLLCFSEAGEARNHTTREPKRARHSQETTFVTTTERTTTTEAATTTAAEIRPSLFCWVVAMAEKRGIQVNSEVELMRNGHKRGIGIFDCNRWAVFSDKVVTLAAGKDGPNTTAIPGPPSVLGQVPNAPPDQKMLLNTGVFFRAWDKVLQDKMFEPFDWTIKLDPDCVFFPERLRLHLRQGKYDPLKPINFNNCQKWNSMQGPIELFSLGAMKTFSARIDECKKKIDQSAIGEDIFMQKCVSMLGFSTVGDWKLLNDQYCWHSGNACANDGWTVGFHPYKGVDLWNACYDTADH